MLHFLVMEHLEGETLAGRLRRGPTPLAQTLDIAAQMAEALDAAHKHGIIHRDLKPGNVMLTTGGAGRTGTMVAKLLDFGLAKLAGHGERPATVSDATAPTRTAPITERGTILGTLPYMAPEQLEGKEADARTDLWALGAILYEMIAGRRAFEGDSQVSLIGNIMNAEPASLQTLQPLAPPALERVVRKCLAKPPDDRWDTAHDVADELRWIAQTSGTGAQAGAVEQRRRVWPIALLAVGVLAGAMIGAGAMWRLRSVQTRSTVVRSTLEVIPAEELNAGGRFGGSTTPGGARTALAWSPDGQALVFVGRRGGVRQLYVRRLDASDARPLPKTEGAQVLAVSADGQSVAFWAAGAIRTVPLGGGLVKELASGLPVAPKGLSWSLDGRLFFGRDDGRIWVIPAPGGAPAAVTKVGEAEVRHMLPWPLPDGRTLLYTVRKRNFSWGDEEVVAETLSTGQRTVVLRDAADARYVPTGHLVFMRRGQLFAVPFDAERLATRGPEVPVLDTVAQAVTDGHWDNVTGAGQFAVAATGTLAWVAGPVAPYPDKAPATVDRHGQVARIPAAPVRSYGPAVRLSPDGRQLVMVIFTLTERAVWVYDLGRETLTPLPLTLGSEAYGPKWFPDGQRVAFGWLKDGRRSLAVQSADRTTPPRVLAAGELNPSFFTPDGRQLMASRGEGDMVLVNVENGQAGVAPIVGAPQKGGSADLSPDGRWLAYVSNDTGRGEVFVRPYPGPGAPEPVSVEGGRSPAWNPKGGELFFLSLFNSAVDTEARMMAVDFADGSPPRIGRPRVLFKYRLRDVQFDCIPSRCYDVAPGGQRFYVMQSPTPPPRPVVTHINLVQNWVEELKEKARASGQKK